MTTLEMSKSAVVKCLIWSSSFRIYGLAGEISKGFLVLSVCLSVSVCLCLSFCLSVPVFHQELGIIAI